MKQSIRPVYALALVLAITVPATAHAVFNGKAVLVTSPTWASNTPGESELGFTDSRLVTASNAVTPDLADFRAGGGGTADAWDIDFNQNTITLDFAPIYIRTLGDQVDYMYMTSTGFHFQDSQGQLPPIVGISVDDAFAPFGFDRNLVRFDENNIWVSLQGSMCHFYGMGSMPSCTNPNSPTGYDNRIKVTVQFAGGASEPVALDKARVDRLFDWAEMSFPELFPSREASFEILGYYARFYPATGIYVGIKDGHVYATGGGFGAGIVDLGSLESVFNQAGL
ncbi:MAG: hypothetical protein ACNA7G_04520 [Methylobacter sp.]